MRSHSGEFFFYTDVVSRGKLCFFEVSGAPIKIQCPAGTPWSDLGPQIKSRVVWGPWGTRVDGPLA